MNKLNPKGLVVELTEAQLKQLMDDVSSAPDSGCIVLFHSDYRTETLLKCSNVESLLVAVRLLQSRQTIWRMTECQSHITEKYNWLLEYASSISEETIGDDSFVLKTDGLSKLVEAMAAPFVVE